MVCVYSTDVQAIVFHAAQILIALYAARVTTKLRLEHVQYVTQLALNALRQLFAQRVFQEGI